MKTVARRRRKHRRRLPRSLRLPAALLAAVMLLLAVWLLVFRDNTPSPAAVAPEWVEQALLPINAYSRSGDKLEAVNGIVIHNTGNPGTTAAQNRSYFAGLAGSHETHASSNFIVGLKGEVLQAVPSDEVAYASSQRNYDTLSIEVCHSDATGEFGDETMDSLVALVQWLVDYYKLDRSQIIRHYDVTGKECPVWYVQHPEAWEAFLDELDFSHGGS